MVLGPSNGIWRPAGRLFGIVAAITVAPLAAQAHEDALHCYSIKKSVSDGGFANLVTVNCYNGQALISSDTYPDHPLMTGIVGTNEQVPVPAADYVSPIPLQPNLGTAPHTRDASLGVAVNGVPIYD